MLLTSESDHGNHHILQMPHYATLSNTPSIYDDKVIGYAVEGTDIYTIDSYLTIYMTVMVIFEIFILGLSTSLFVTISKSIETTDKGKSKLYYHFWSAAVLIVVGLWVYEVIYHVHNIKSYQSKIPYSLLLMLMVMISFFGTIIAFWTVGGKVKLFSAPLSGCCCCTCSKRCRTGWSCCMTAIGMYLMISLVTYLLYATPTIVFVYYLYPTRTLIRVPFIIGAIFYTIALQSLVLYQFEKVIHVMCCGSHECSNIDEDMKPLVENNTPNSFGTQSLEVNNTGSRSQICPCNCELDKQHIEKQHRLNNEYYTEKFEEDLKIISKSCYTLIAFAQLLAGIAMLIAFIYGEIVIANLVFKQTNNTDINSLLALLPTVIVSVFAWFGRSFIFDVREDIKELSKKESVEEKILNVLNEQVKLQRSRIEQESQNRQGNNEDADIQSDIMNTAEDTV